MTEQIDLFNPFHSAEYLQWLTSPIGTPAPAWLRYAKKGKPRG